MTDQLPVFDTLVKKRGRSWRWCVCTTEGKVVMYGVESSRPGAKYQADRALFQLLLSAPYRSIRSRDPNGKGYNRSGQTRSAT